SPPGGIRAFFIPAVRLAFVTAAATIIRRRSSFRSRGSSPHLHAPMTKTGEAARPSLALEPETFLDTASRYQKPIIIGAIVLAASIGGLFLWQRSGVIKETRAGEALAAAETAFGAGNPQLA